MVRYDRSLISKAILYLKRLIIFLVQNNCFKFSEKLRIVSSFDMLSTIRHLLLKRLIESNGESFFSICGYKIYFQPDYEISDQKYFMRAITQILRETFIFPEYFNSKAYIREGDIVLDIGASIGTTTLYFSKIVGEKGKVFAFEPVTPDVISLNLKMNKIKNVIVIPKAVSNKVGKTEIEISDYCIDSSICKREYTSNYYTKKKKVDMISLDYFTEHMGLDKIDFIKMDIEGAEELAIRGAKRVIEKYRPKLSISSYHIDFNNEPQHNKLVKLLKESGYKINEIKGHHIYAW